MLQHGARVMKGRLVDSRYDRTSGAPPGLFLSTKARAADSTRKPGNKHQAIANCALVALNATNMSDPLILQTPAASPCM